MTHIVSVGDALRTSWTVAELYDHLCAREAVTLADAWSETATSLVFARAATITQGKLPYLAGYPPNTLVTKEMCR